MSMMWLLGVAAVFFGIVYLIRGLIMLGKPTTWVIKVPPKIKKYFKENPGASFIIVFQILLLVYAGLLILGSSLWAEGLAVVAYFSLVVGVVLQLISFVRHREESEQE